MTKPKKPTVTALPAANWPPAPPADFDEVSLALYEDLVGRYRFSPVEMKTVHDACRTASIIARLQTDLDRDGTTLTQPSGRVAAHPAASEIRQQRLTQARLIASLRLPSDDANKSQRRQTRGVYKMNGA